MKSSRSTVRCKAAMIPTLRFEDQSLTSFAGLVVFQALFQRLRLKERLRQRLRQVRSAAIYGLPTVVLQMIVHLLLGFRELRDLRYYRDDPIVKRVLGLKQIPTVATVSRALRGASAASVANLRRLLRDLVSSRLVVLNPARLTLDFDGSVLSTKRYAEGAAPGFNKKKKGARSYYPLFCTIAQTGQVFDLLHRPGNVHDSNGAEAFIRECLRAVRRLVPRARLEVRMDSAFFSDTIVGLLDDEGVEFSLSVPFERFPVLKTMIEGRQRWHRLDDEIGYFESPWKPKSWDHRFRFVFIRTRVKKQRKGPVQLDLFVPHAHGYDFKVIVTNKPTQVRNVLEFHNGRGSQEGIFAELKSQAHGDYVPTKTLVGNQIYLLCATLAHNLGRELQMAAHPATPTNTAKRAARWTFQQLQTIRRNLIQRAGRMTWPKGRLTLTMSANSAVQSEITHYLDALGHTS